MNFKFLSRHDRVHQLLLWMLLLAIGTAVIFFNLLWNSNLPIFSLTKQPSLYYAVFRSIQGFSSIFLNILLLFIGYILSKSGKTKIQYIIQQWLSVFIISILLFIVFSMGFNAEGLNNFFDTIFPLARNTYPLVTGLFLGQLAIPVLKKLLTVYDSKTIFRSAIILGIIPTIFNKDIIGFSTGNTTLFAFYMFMLGSLLAITDAKLINRHTKWLIFFILSDLFLNLIMPYISFGIHIDLSTAGRFTPSSSAFNILISIFLFDGFKSKLQKLHINVVTAANIQHLVLYCLATLMISTFGNISKINAINNNLPFTTFWQKFWVVLLEALAFSIILFLCELVLRSLFSKLNMGHKYQSAHVLQAMEIAKNDITKLIFSRGFFTLCVFYLLAAFSLLIMNDAITISPSTLLTMNIFTYTFFVRQQIIWLNVLIILAIFTILRFIFLRRYWFPFILTSLFVVLWSVAAKVKLNLRQEPVVPSDMAELKNIGSLLGMIDLKLVIALFSTLVVFLVLALYLQVKHPGANLSFGKMTIYTVLALIFLSGAFFANHANTPPKILLDLMGDSRFFQNQANGARANGSLLQFINNIDVKVMDQPAGYSQSRMQKIAQEYANIQRQINKGRSNKIADQTIIMGLSESFSDPFRVPGLNLNKDPMLYIRSLKKQTTSGIMISGGYGGGTANMEYMALTGFGLSNFSPTLSTPYTQLVDHMNVAPSFVKSFNYSAAIHPYQGVYYNRPNVYRKFGIDKFAYLGSKTPIKYQKKIDNSNYLSDYTAYQNALAQIKSRRGGQFINLITMQNHLPYNAGTYNNTKFHVSGEAVMNPTNATNIEQYTMGMNFTDQETRKFIQQLDNVNKPITFVFYGDHLPGNYPGVPMKENELKMHETDYFIYSNKYAREHNSALNKIDRNSTKFVSPTNFFALAAEQSNSKVDPYVALLTKVNQDLPTYGSDIFDKENRFVDANGKPVGERALSKHQKKLPHDYQLVQYDMTAGQQYLARAQFFAR